MTDAKQEATRGIGRRTRKGLVWTFASTVGVNAVRVVSIPVLARLLDPVDFGVVAAALTVVIFAQTLRDIGVGSALVQRKEIEPEHVHAAFAFALSMGLALGAIGVLAAPLVGAFYDRSELVPLVRMLSLLFVLRGVASVPQALCRRELKFRALAAIDFSSFFIGSVTAIGLAAAGFRAWSLVWGYILEALISTVALFALKPQRIRRPRWQYVKDLLGFGSGNTLSDIAGYFAYQGDYMVVGNQLGAEPLGFYTRAYDLMRVPAVIFSNLSGWVLFSAFSRLQDNPVRLGRALRRGSFLLATILLPVSAALVSLAPESVRILLGKGWSDAVVPFQILAACMLARAGFQLSANIARSSGDVFLMALCNIVYGALVITGALIGCRWGITGVAISTSIACVINFVLFSYLGLRRTTLSWGQFIAIHGEALIAAFATFAAVDVCARYLRAQGLIDIAVVALASLAGAVAAIAVMAIGVRRSQEDWIWLWTAIRKKLRRRAEAVSS